MAANSKIEWTDATWNPVRGCTRVSEGCRNCYAEVMAARFSDPGQWGHGFAERTSAGPRWTGKVALQEDKLLLPLHWREPRHIFVNSTSDLFHEKLTDADIDKVFAVMALCPHHILQILTKRPERARAYFTKPLQGPWAGRSYRLQGGKLNPSTDVDFRMPHVICEMLPKAPPEALNRASKWQEENGYGEGGFMCDWPLPNVWLGTSVEDRGHKSRIDDLRATPAALRFLSLEPLLEDLGDLDLTGIGWVIAGGESGREARPMHPDWARSLRDQCRDAGVPFFFKQWGEFAPIDLDDISSEQQEHLELAGHLHGNIARVGKKRAGALLDGREHREFPQ